MKTILKKRAFTLVETLICTALLSILIWATVLIIGMSNYSITEASKEFNKVNGYDIFLDSYLDSIKNATEVKVSNGTVLFARTPSGIHTYEFDRNRLFLDGNELFEAHGGGFYRNTDSVKLIMQPKGYGDIELTVYIDCEGS